MSGDVYMDDLNYVLKQIRPCDTDKPYIFVSYSSRDSELVWRDVLTFQRQGYNVWLDEKNLDKTKPSWKNDALKAIRDKDCKLVLFYVSASSLCSEACLNEMAETVSEKTRMYHKKKPVKYVAVDAEQVGNILDFYDKVFDEISEKEKAEFEKQVEVLDTFLSKFFGNNNERVRIHPKTEPGRKGDYYDDIYASFPDEALVYSPVQPEPPITSEPPVLTEPPVQPEPLEPDVEKYISLPDFLKKYNTNTFSKETFQQVRLVGQGEYAAYSTPFFDSVYPVVWSFVTKLLEERGEAYLRCVNETYSDSKNPPFITAEEHQKRKDEKQPIAYRRLEVPGLEGWSMCRNYGQYNWVSDVLRRRMQEAGMPLDAFAFEYVEPGQARREAAVPKPAAAAQPEQPVKPDVSAGGITSPVNPDGGSWKPRKQTLAKDGYRFVLYGQQYENLKLKEMMLAVFKQTLDRHPDKLGLLLENLPCLGQGELIHRDAKPATFRAGSTHMVGETKISIGTSLGQGQVLNYIGRLMRICGEGKENLVIDGYDY